MKRAIAMMLVAGVSWMGFLNCVGTFALTGRLNRWVVGVRDKGGLGWKLIGWIVFILLLIIPVYQISMFLDAVIFNSMEFWMGSNPMAYNENGEATRVAIKGNEKAVFHYTQSGQRLQISFFKEGTLVKELVLKKDEPGVFYALVNGALVPIHADTEETAAGRKFRVFEGDRQLSAGILNRAQIAAMDAKVAEAVGNLRQYAAANKGGAL